jgi:hypothetical protein
MCSPSGSSGTRRTVVEVNLSAWRSTRASPGIPSCGRPPAYPAYPADGASATSGPRAASRLKWPRTTRPSTSRSRPHCPRWISCHRICHRRAVVRRQNRHHRQRRDQPEQRVTIMGRRAAPLQGSGTGFDQDLGTHCRLARRGLKCWTGSAAEVVNRSGAPATAVGWTPTRLNLAVDSSLARMGRRLPAELHV